MVSVLLHKENLFLSNEICTRRRRYKLYSFNKIIYECSDGSPRKLSFRVPAFWTLNIFNMFTTSAFSISPRFVCPQVVHKQHNTAALFESERLNEHRNIYNHRTTRRCKEKLSKLLMVTSNFILNKIQLNLILVINAFLI